MEESLAGFERHLVERDGLAGQRLRSGLVDAEIDRLSASLPFGLPDELRCLYRWHDGAFELDERGEGGFPRVGVLYSLSQAMREYARWTTMPTTDETYDPAWIPVSGAGGRLLVADSGALPGHASPIHHIDIDESVEWDLIRAPSLVYMINVWDQMIYDGHWVCDAETGLWRDGSETPEHLSRTLLV